MMLARDRSLGRVLMLSLATTTSVRSMSHLVRRLRSDDICPMG